MYGQSRTIPYSHVLQDPIRKSKVTLLESSHLWTHANMGTWPGTPTCSVVRGDKWVPRQMVPGPIPPLGHPLPCHQHQGTIWAMPTMRAKPTSSDYPLPNDTGDPPTSTTCQGWLTWLGRGKGGNCRPKKVFFFMGQDSPLTNK